MEYSYVFCMACTKMFKIWDYIGTSRPLQTCPHCDYIGKVEIGPHPRFNYTGYILGQL